MSEQDKELVEEELRMHMADELDHLLDQLLVASNEAEVRKLLKLPLA